MSRVLVLLAVFALSWVQSAPSENLVTSVPGFPGDLPFKAYAGYLPANDGHKMMFYFFSTSQNDPTTDPVVLWLNGGPGCSSLDGFVYEHGPFTFNNGPMGADQNLTLNPYSWTKVASVIYLDSPCGVGLSYSTDPSVDYITNDTVTAHDSHNFLLNFFQAYPEFAANDFYIAGESYAGIYVPTLSQQVLLGNQNDPSTAINMKGYFVGNGVTDEVFDGNAFVPFIYGHSFISDELYDSIVEECGLNNTWNPTTPTCNNLLGNASNLVAGLNIYNVYLDCFDPSTEENPEMLHNADYRATKRYRSEVAKSEGMRSRNVGFDVPCIDSDRANAWINLPATRTALHAVPVSTVNWTICSGAIDYTSTYTTVIPIHQQLLEAGYRAMIYSGDADMCVPNTGTEAWTDSLNLPLVADWQPWMLGQQIAGYVRAYKGLTYATIKGAGHMVPEYRPPQALEFFTKFLNNQPLA